MLCKYLNKDVLGIIVRFIPDNLPHHAEVNDIVFVELMLESRVDVDVEDTWGYTALMRASKNGHILCVKLLLECNANVNMKNPDGNTALMFASENGHNECVKLLLEYNAKVFIYSEYFDRALSLASDNGHKECVKLLKEKYERDVVNIGEKIYEWL